MHQSIVHEGSQVKFPEFLAERVYMKEFFKESGLPNDLQRWQSTVNAMLEGVDVDGPIYLTIDQKDVAPNTSHRREGLHIDGYWVKTLGRHGGGHKGLPEEILAWGGGPSDGKPYKGWGGTQITPLKKFKRMPNGKFKLPKIDPETGRTVKETPKKKASGAWEEIDLTGKESIILASDVIGCRAFEGEWDGMPMDGGDCSHIDVSNLQEVIFDKNIVYRGNVGMLHESMPILLGGKRTVVRLNVPGWSPIV